MIAVGKPLRIGVFGAGWVSQYHLRAWQRLKGQAEVVGIADPDATARARRAREFGIAATFERAEALLDGVSPDAVDICAPREFHAPLVRLAADRGLPVLCQKPLAPTLAEAQRLVGDVGARVPLMVHENWRFRRTFRRVGAWLREGAAGAPRQVQLEVLSSGTIVDANGERPAVARQPFFSSLDRLLVTEVLIHHLDALRFLLGEMDVEWARLSRSTDAIAGEDIATILLSRREDGVPVTVSASMAVHGAPPLPRDRLRIFGSEGTIALDGGEIRVAGRVNAEAAFDPDETYQGSYDAVMAHFIGELRGGLRFETSPADNLKTLALVEAVYAAAAGARQRVENRA